MREAVFTGDDFRLGPGSLVRQGSSGQPYLGVCMTFLGSTKPRREKVVLENK
jgi:hypothetical protein